MWLAAPGTMFSAAPAAYRAPEKFPSRHGSFARLDAACRWAVPGWRAPRPIPSSNRKSGCPELLPGATPVATKQNPQIGLADLAEETVAQLKKPRKAA